MKGKIWGSEYITSLVYILKYDFIISFILYTPLVVLLATR